MALALVGGSVLSAALQVLFERAFPRNDFFTSWFRKIRSKKKSEAEAVGELRDRILSHSLLAIKQVLDDAADVEDMQVMKPEVRKWLDDLAELLYDVEDFLDETDGETQLPVLDSPNHEDNIVSPQQNDPQVHSSPHPSTTLRPLRRFLHCFPAFSAPAPHGPNPTQSPSSSNCSVSSILNPCFPPRGREAPVAQQYTSPSDQAWLYSRSAAQQHTSPSDQAWLYSRPAAQEHTSPSDQAWLYSRTELPRFMSVDPMEKKMVCLTQKVELLCKRLDDLQTKMHVLDLKKGVKGKLADRLPTTGIPDEDHLYGRTEQLGRILDFQRQNAGYGNKMSVIAIWGMPGVGKTSLAQHMYYNATFNDCFDKKAWICVSDDFNVVRFTKMMLDAVSEQRFDTDDLNILQVTLSNKLSGMRFLLVLDDVWNEKFDSWDALLKPLKLESKETMVILTTQHRSVSTYSNADVTLQLDLLSAEDCYTIIKKHATRPGTNLVDEMLEDVCRRIAFKCKGLPLAAKAAGRLLRATPREDWVSILNSDTWNLVHDDRTNVLPVLKLSYQYLPSYLKPCISYCSLFPKDYEYEQKKLILLWIAEGLLRKPHDGKNIEEEGKAYFEELFSRSFFQRSSSNASCFVMHDLFHDLAQSVSKKFFCRVDHNKEFRMSSKIRHLSYQRRNCDNLSKLNPFNSLGQLRTFIAIDSPADYFYVSLRAMNDLVPMLKSVRVLSLSHYQIYHLSAAVGELKHLRFLDVSFTMIKHLPGTICNLGNLQILLLSNCLELIELPPDMHRLTSLCHLDLTGTALKKIPSNMSDLSSLQRLGKIVTDPSDLHKLRELKHLQGSLRVSISDGTPSLSHGSESYLQQFEGLEELEMDLTSASSDSDFQKEVLNLLEPHCSLKKLSIRGYGGRAFPDWLSCRKYSCLVSLHIINCEFCLFLPSLGDLPSLEHLRLSLLEKVTSIGAEFYGGDSQRTGAFQSLKTLIFENMPEWRMWLPREGIDGDFRCLQELYVRDCPMLSKQLPSDIPFLKKLVISKCPQLDVSPDLLPLILKPEPTVPDSMRTIPLLSSIELSFLPQLRKLPQEIQHLTSLKSLEISNIPTVESFLDSPFPESLMYLRIDECNALVSLPNRLIHIVTLVISSCPSLKFFPENGLPASLKILKVKHCRNLQFMSFQDLPQKPNLTTLEIENSCDSLTSFALNSFPELCHLKISNCRNLESLCLLGSSNKYLRLLHLYISECMKLEEISLPEGGFPAPSLQEFTLSCCPSLKSVPKDMFKGVTSLESLNLDGCPELRPVLDWHNLPSGLVSVSVTDAIYNSVWLNRQLYSFRALKHLKLDGLEVESFPEPSWVPSRVTALTISNFPNLKSIDDEGIKSLKRLEEFVIRNCPKVSSIPKDGFHSSLLYLQSVGCPLLEQDILGKERVKVARIPCVIVGYTVI